MKRVQASEGPDGCFGVIELGGPSAAPTRCRPGGTTMPLRGVTLATLLATSGCITISGGQTRLGTIARDPITGFRAVGPEVVGEACSQPLSTDDYRLAMFDALRKAPGAEVLANVTLYA